MNLVPAVIAVMFKPKWLSLRS